jgi:hypothetical protein
MDMKTNINLGNSSKFVGYNTNGITNCLDLCKKILSNYGLTSYGSSSHVFKLMYEQNGKLSYYGQNPQDNYRQAINCIDRHLENNRPIIVGVNHTINRNINEGTTDHFVVIYGRGYDDKLKQYYYTYYEVGKGTIEKGYDDNLNRFYYVDSDKPLLYDSESRRGDKARFDVIQVRPNDGDNNGTVAQNS